MYFETLNVADLVPGNLFRFTANGELYMALRPDADDVLGRMRRVQLTGIASGHVAPFVSAESQVQRCLTHEGEVLKHISTLAQTALDVQDACNLSGVVHSFSRVLTHLREYLRVAGLPCGTADINAHPIVVMFVDKLADMSGRGENFSEAYTAVQELADFTTPDFLPYDRISGKPA